MDAWDPQHWDPAEIANRPIIGVQGNVYRAHLASRKALDSLGYLYGSGRFHRGVLEFGQENAWPALYLSETTHIAQGEYTRHLKSLKGLRNLRISCIKVRLSRVADCQDLGALNITDEQLLEDTDYTAGQSLAAAAIEANYEGIVVPTATNYRGVNLVVFTDRLRRDSSLETIDHEDPDLYPKASN